MTYYCKLWVETTKSLTKYKHFKSKSHTSFTNSFIMRYIILNPNFDEIDGIMGKYVIIQNKKYEEYDVHCSINLITTTNHVRYIKIKPQSSLQFSFYVPEKFIFSKINQDRNPFS